MGADPNGVISFRQIVALRRHDPRIDSPPSPSTRAAGRCNPLQLGPATLGPLKIQAP